ncbi:hypothetical protein [Micromonospora sp. NPDC049662]|uniref:hypothetical protein n=1 Tax=Micromonospora sp. NPDC049662 TaxID=3155397 RepID=UPI003415411A
MIECRPSGSAARWPYRSPTTCETCRQVPQASHDHRVRVVTETATTTEVAASLVDSARRGNELREWQQVEFARLAEPLRLTASSVPLAEWQRQSPPSLGASVDAFDRYGVMPVPNDLSSLRQAQNEFMAAAR